MPIRAATATLALASALTLAVTAPAAAETWTKLATSGLGPSERSSPAVAAVGQAVFVFGGVKDDFTAAADVFFQDLYRLDVATGHWESIAITGEAPPARAFAGAVGDGRRSRLVVFGGAHYGPFFSDFVAYDDLWTFDPDAAAWQRVRAKNAGPVGRSAPLLWMDGNRLYVFGGITESFATLNDLWSYDFSTNRWRQLSADGAAGAPPSRHEAMGGDRPQRGRLTLYGGEHFDPAQGFVILNDTWEWDLGCGRWQQVAPNPDIAPARNYAAAALLGNRIYLQGGDLPGGSSGCGAPYPQNPTDETWRYHTVRRRWERITPDGDPPTRLKRHEAARIGDSMYVLAGWDFRCDAGGPGQIWNIDVFELSID